MGNHWMMFESPIYESDKLNERLKFAYWEGHRDFAYDLLNFVRPFKLVELGSQYGCSLFAFCQSVKDNGLDTQINAIDFWRGNIGAEDTGEEVYELVQNIKNEFFSELKIDLYQMEFDSALSSFEEESIDILHLDGGHRFEDVEHDLSMWLPKLKKDGIILFHDVFSHIDEGSCIHWTETKTKYKNYFEFRHSCGLGILFPKGDYWFRKIVESGFVERYKEVYYYRSLFQYTQNRLEELKKLYEKRYVAIQEQSKMIEERDEAMKGLQQLCKERYEAIQNQSRMIEERDEAIKGLQQLCEERYEAIQSQSEMIAERDRTIEEQVQMCDERYAVIKEQEKMIMENDIIIKEKENV
jgi:predicted O-methyltransferase YrrM